MNLEDIRLGGGARKFVSCMVVLYSWRHEDGRLTMLERPRDVSGAVAERAHAEYGGGRVVTEASSLAVLRLLRAAAAVQ